MTACETEFTSNLKAFNRKERFFLIGTALGNPEFFLCENFIAELRKEIGSDEIDFSKCGFVAMDYHLDWIYASLFLVAEGISIKDAVSSEQCWKREKGNLLISATQQDIDLVAVFPDIKDKSRNHLLLIEAKGVGAWNKKQLHAKGDRIAEIFKDQNLLDAASVVPHFVYVAPKRKLPSKTCLQGLPEIMRIGGKPPIVSLTLPEPLVKVTQCLSDNKTSGNGNYWKISCGS